MTIGLFQSVGRHRRRRHLGLPRVVQTDLTPVNRTQAPLTADEAERTVVDAALLPVSAASGWFVDAGGPVPW